MLQKIFIIMILIPCFVSLSGCLNSSHNNDNTKEMILGVWKRMNNYLYQTWEFKQNGTISISNTSLIMIYWFENNSLFTYVYGVDIKDEYTYQFNGNDELKLTMIASNEIRIDPDTGELVPFEPMEIVFQRVN